MFLFKRMPQSANEIEKVNLIYSMFLFKLTNVFKELLKKEITLHPFVK